MLMRALRSVFVLWVPILLSLLLAAPEARAQIDLQGHRGARGLLPENTIAGVVEALDHAVQTIELDVVISADGEVVVSHEPWMSGAICRTPAGDDVTAEDERSFNIFQMTYEEVAAFDCGSRGHADFPRQRQTAAAKPLLRQLIRIADGYTQRMKQALPLYNVEIKSHPDGDGRYHPDPEDFARLVYDVLAEEDVLDRSSVQSFDPRSLQAVRALDPSMRLALLVSNDLGYAVNLERLGFVPEIYSPNYDLVDEALLDSAHADGLLVIPWTVNDRGAMRELLELGVDGLITDYPDVGRAVVDEFEEEAGATQR